MKRYKINEIFYSLQGEGVFTGKAALFVRFSGCNLKCPFCDTDFKSHREMTSKEIIAYMKGLSNECVFVVLTGGEPTLQVDDNLIDNLHEQGYFVAMETNGTNVLPFGIDWVTCSPKNLFVDKAEPVIAHCNELKVVFNGEHPDIRYDSVKADHYYLQPCDTGKKERNAEILNKCIEYIKKNPRWRLSLQTQKIINVR